jgi:hypothetical protein
MSGEPKLPKKRTRQLYVARGVRYRVYVRRDPKSALKIATIDVPSRVSRKVPVERLKVAPGLRRHESRR